MIDFVMLRYLLSLVLARFYSVSKLLSQSMMGLSDHNEGNISVLDALDEIEEADSFQVWDHVDENVSLYAIEQALSRYYKMGLVGKTRKPDRVYFLTEKGFERLNFLLDSE